MKSNEAAPLYTWLIEPTEPPVREAVERLRRAPDVRHVAVMPDVHLASEVCVGVVLGTSRLVYPQAVGGDIGCGMLAVQFDARADRLRDPQAAGRVLAGIGRLVPPLRRNRRHLVPFPQDLLLASPLSHPSLESLRRDDGALQLGTLGSGNHFVELQSDETDSLWLMIHSGSRAMGQAIRGYHLARAEPVGSGLKALDSTTEPGRAYVRDVAWARRYADANRRAMAGFVGEVMSDVIGAAVRWDTLFTTDHNHVAAEQHGGQTLWVHRKGATPASAGVACVLPGSMGTPSYHVIGRGCAESLCSGAHGAGRALSREAARRAVRERDVHRQMQGIWFDYRLAAALRDEAPAAYKDIRAVLRAQHELVSVTRTLHPVLSYKGR